jgi:hypothetical protein
VRKVALGVVLTLALAVFPITLFATSAFAAVIRECATRRPSITGRATASTNGASSASVAGAG